MSKTVEGSVSYRHDPMDAIEEALRHGDFHEIILSTTLPHGVSRNGLPRRGARDRPAHELT